MAYDYDKLFGETANALGNPTAEFVSFFRQYEQADARILDIGCGQGRDALFIARLGHSVVGVDCAPNGIKDLITVAKKEQLSVEGIVADINNYQPDGLFDIIIIDRTLHMLSKDSRLRVLMKLLDYVLENGWLLIADEASNINAFEQIFADHFANWMIEYPRRGLLFVHRNAS